MVKITSSMRLKVKRDTFFLPDPSGGVYFRNNLSSFRMEGSSIDQWIEKLLPMFNGENTLGDLTDGLPGPYRDRVFEIAEVLFRNNFVRDVSEDRPHQLADYILEKHASQIEFLESFGDSGAYRFQTYRQSKVLAVGSGPILVSLVSALLESGLPRFHVFIMDTEQTNRHRILELVSHARKTDPEVNVEEVILKEEGMNSWQELVQGYDSILYVSEGSDLEELRILHAVCLDRRKMFIPAICLQQVGLAGPLVKPDSIGCWESAWRRLHKSVLSEEKESPAFSPTAGAMLANVIVFELFKEMTRVEESEQEQHHQIFLLNLETLEGNWHSFIPHPLVAGLATTEWVQDLDFQNERSNSKNKQSDLLLFFSHLTSAESGIFHVWEEGDLHQLPLSQCRVQVVDLLSEGPAELLPEIICSGLTHEEARREAGLAGIEAYVSRFTNTVDTIPEIQKVHHGLIEEKEYIGVGTGETVSECVARGLQSCLEEEMSKKIIDREYSVSRILLREIEDERCLFYFQALKTIKGEPNIGLGEEVSGFPVIWIGTNDGWFRSTGLNMTMALRNALQKSLMYLQNEDTFNKTQPLEVSSVNLEDQERHNLIIPSCEGMTEQGVLTTAMEILERNHKKLSVFKLQLEPLWLEGLEGIYGVLLRKEESR
ncbi:putative thiazole-containing bacteriocin maturation protein [Oikeobacillus pervagus]|uniref:Thiazole-containing bacteriocin maturation protein n=1 Tax=Oikeobacillus pervagus TaxID=1325931 RepID=A0AAJ1T3R2_9BACI|nr:putative thiazole-containing bacteriocin maturation protein [Oikeobacillus pervagus]MDQ0216071.1 putative thiazole-containing bacteriocin maturation protein [Oikeobacillus pervagus]